MRTASSMRSTPRPVISAVSSACLNESCTKLIAQVAADELEPGALLLHELGLGVGLARDQAEHLVALRRQQLAEVPTVLPGDTGDERALHAFLSAWWFPAVATAGIRPRLPRKGGIARSLGVRIELDEEFGTPVGLVALADRRRHAPQPVERREEPAVLGMGGPHVAGAAPARL